MLNHYVAVISVDALVQEDLALLLHMKNSAELFSHCACVENMETVYPSLTHPVHATLISGCACGKTGILHNERFEPLSVFPTWYNQLADIQCETIFHVAHQHGLTSCAARWPVTARGNRVIDYIVPEVLDNDLENASNMEVALAQGGAASIMENVVRPHLCLLHGNSRPGYDAFSAACASDIVRQYKPNLLFTHWGIVDSARHHNGVFGSHIQKALEFIDQWIGWLVEAYRNVGIMKQTDIILLSDHGQLDVTRKICLNALFAQQGLLKLDEKGTVISWDAFALGDGLSAQVYLRNPNNKELYYHVLELLTKHLPEKADADFQLLTPDETRQKYGLYGAFSWVIETDGQTLFGNETTRPWMEIMNALDCKTILAAHGHLPNKGPQPPFLAVGPSFLSGKTLKNGSILDVAPSIAKIMGFALPHAEGRPMNELFSTSIKQNSLL